MAILRGESGGAITETELAEKLSTYVPGPLDTPEVARSKFERYKRDLQNTLTTSEKGRGQAPTVAPVAPSTTTSPAEGMIQQGMDWVGNMAGKVTGGAEQTAINPQTGERLVLRNGQWVPQ